MPYQQFQCQKCARFQERYHNAKRCIRKRCDGRLSMVISRTKTRKQLARMSNDRLQRYFENHARFHDGSPGCEYAIRFESKTLWSDDTMKLRNKFFKQVRKGR